MRIMNREMAQAKLDEAKQNMKGGVFPDPQQLVLDDLIEILEWMLGR